MALPGACAVIFGVSLVAACSPFGGGEFHCMTSDQCAGGANGGMCEVDGFCSFPNGGCSSGRAYGGFSGSLSNTCVGGGTPIDADGDALDTIDMGTTDTAIDMSMPAPFCDAAGEPALVGCWEFENNTLDASGDGNNATATNTAFAIGHDGQGITLNNTSHIATGDRASLEPPSITFELWIRPTALPTGTARMGLIDSGGAYGLFLNATGIRCTNGGGPTHAVTIPLNQWSHIACTFDGTGRVYVNGLAIGVAWTGAPLATGDTVGTVLGCNSPSGEQLIGTIDQFRIWNVARTAGQICRAAGLSGCP